MNINKLSLPATILLSAVILGGFYYASELNKQKSIERQQQMRIEHEQKEQSTQEYKVQQNKELLDSCLAAAEENYTANWFNACKATGALTNWCIKLNDMTLDDYIRQKGYPKERRFEAIHDFYDEKKECSCMLPAYNADSITKARNDEKNDCFKTYPQR